MRTHHGVAPRPDQQQQLLMPLMALLLMVVAPALFVAMTQATGPLSRFVLGAGAALAVAAAGVYLYRLGKAA